MGICDSITSTVTTTCKNVRSIFWGSSMFILTELINYYADILHSSEAKRKIIVK